MKKILFIGYFGNPQLMMDEVKEYFDRENQQMEYHLLVDKKKYDSNPTLKVKVDRCGAVVDQVHILNVSKIDSVRSCIESLGNELWAVVPKGETMLDLFRAVIPMLPDHVHTPTAEAIRAASEKSLMRKVFQENCPELSIRSKSFAFDDEGGGVAEQVKNFSFPVIVKPNGLSTSMFVSHVLKHEDLAEAFDDIKGNIRYGHIAKGGRGEIEIIVEEMIQGELFSIDSYINSIGDIIHTPVVQVETGIGAGRDDGYYGYLQSTPATISDGIIERLQVATERAINAVGLRSSTAHTELILRRDGSVGLIEIGPRPGGYRTVMYRISANIPHFLNDILTRVDIEPIVEEPTRAVTFMKIYPKKEGVLKEIHNLEKVRDLANIVVVQKKIGQKVAFAQNGGLSAVDVVVEGALVDDTLLCARMLDSEIGFVIE